MLQGWGAGHQGVLTHFPVSHWPLFKGQQRLQRSTGLHGPATLQSVIKPGVKDDGAPPRPAALLSSGS